MSKSISIRRASVMVVVSLAFLALPLGRLAFAPPEGPADPTTIRRLVDEADHRLKRGRFQDALAYAEAALEKDEDNVPAHQVRAEVCAVWRIEYNKKALEESRKALTAQGAQIPEIVLFMDQINSGQADKVKEAIRDIIGKNPDTARRSLYCYILSRASAKQGKGEVAMTELSDALGWDPAFEQAYHDLANIYVQLGNTDLAERLCNRLLSRNPGNREWHLLTASVEARSNKTATAKRIANRVIESLEDVEEGRNLGLAYYVLASADYKDYERLPETEKLNEYLEDSRKALNRVSEETDADEKLAALEDSLRKALPFVVDREIIRDVRDKILEARKKEDAKDKAALAEEAIEPMETLLKKILEQKGELLKDALANADKAIKADKLLAEPYALLAGYYTRQGDLEKAAQEYEKYLAIRKDARNYQYMLGLIRLAQGKMDKAKGVFAEIKDDKGEKHELAYVGEALLADLEGKADAARGKYEALAALRDKDDRGEWAMLELMLAHACYAQNKPGDAKPHLEKGVSALGGLMMNDDTDYAALLGASDAKALGRLNLSLALSAVGLPEQALVECRKFREAAPDSVAGRFLEFMLIVQKPERRKEAERLIKGLKDAFAAKDKKNVTPNLAAAMLYNGLSAAEPDTVKREDLEERAIGEYKKALEKDASCGDAYVALAQTYARRGQVKKAEELVEKGLERIVGNRTLLDMYIELMSMDRATTSRKYISIYEKFNTRVESSMKEDIDQQAGVMTLADYYRKLGRNKEARIQYEKARNRIEIIEDAGDLKRKRRQYLSAYVTLRELSLAESEVDKARKYNAEIKKIKEDFPGTDHFEGLCRLIEGKDDEAVKAFEREVALGRLSMDGVMSRAGMALIALKTATSREQLSRVVLDHIDRAQELVDRMRERDSLFGGSPDKMIMTGGYLSFMRACTFLAQGRAREIQSAADILNMTSVLFPGAEGWAATETTAFKGINLKAAIKGWKTKNNFYDLTAGAYYLGRGLYAEASKHLSAELETNPDNFIALLFKARAEMALGNEQTAIDLLNECRQKEDGKFIPAYSTLFNIYVRRDVKPHEEIVELLEKMSGLDSRFRLDLARYYEQYYEVPQDSDIGKHELALKEYDKLCAEEDLPGRWNALNSAAWLRAEHFDDKDNELLKAEKQALKAIELFKKNAPPEPYIRTPAGRSYMMSMATIQDTYGWVLYKQAGNAAGDVKLQKLEKASEVFEECLRSLSINPRQSSLPVVLYHQAVVYDALRESAGDDKDKADKYKKDAVDVLKRAVTYTRFEERTKARELLDKLEALGD